MTRMPTKLLALAAVPGLLLMGGCSSGGDKDADSRPTKTYDAEYATFSAPKEALKSHKKNKTGFVNIQQFTSKKMESTGIPPEGETCSVIVTAAPNDIFDAPLEATTKRIGKQLDGALEYKKVNKQEIKGKVDLTKAPERAAQALLPIPTDAIARGGFVYVRSMVTPGKNRVAVIAYEAGDAKASCNGQKIIDSFKLKKDKLKFDGKNSPMSKDAKKSDSSKKEKGDKDKKSSPKD